MQDPVSEEVENLQIAAQLILLLSVPDTDGPIFLSSITLGQLVVVVSV